MKSPSSKIDAKTERRAAVAAKKVNLSVPDLLRIGLHRVCDEIEETGCLRVGRKAKRQKGHAS